MSGPPALSMATRGPEQTMSMAAAFASICLPDDVVALEGTLGSGKTCFVRGLAHGLAVTDERRVISPTFVLMRRHAGRLTLYHFDAYRLHGADDMEDIGCAETFAGGGVSVVEWADRVGECIPADCFWFTIAVTGESERSFALAARGLRAADRLADTRRVLEPWLVCTPDAP